jgi:hypothetical protein
VCLAIKSLGVLLRTVMMNVPLTELRSPLLSAWGVVKRKSLRAMASMVVTELVKKYAFRGITLIGGVYADMMLPELGWHSH